MELSRLIQALSDPSGYPHPVETVEVHQTHISVVFLAGPLAYKIKKPVDLGFVNVGPKWPRKPDRLCQHLRDDRNRRSSRQWPERGSVAINSLGSGSCRGQCP
jgi:hypothetical protein